MDADYKNPKIDWNYWTNRAHVSLWDACALSLQIDPESFNWDKTQYGSGPNGPMYQSGSRATAVQQQTLAEHGKRLTLLRQNLSNRQFFSPVSADMECDDDVRLPEFAAWFQTLGRLPPLPPQLIGLAAPKGRPPESMRAADGARRTWQNVIRNEALKLLKRNPNAQLDPLAADLVLIAAEQKLVNGRGKPLIAETIKRHALIGIQKASMPTEREKAK
jgi:hypothetical protein